MTRADRITFYETFQLFRDWFSCYTMPRPSMCATAQPTRRLSNRFSRCGTFVLADGLCCACCPIGISWSERDTQSGSKLFSWIALSLSLPEMAKKIMSKSNLSRSLHANFLYLRFGCLRADLSAESFGVMCWGSGLRSEIPRLHVSMAGRCALSQRV